MGKPRKIHPRLEYFVGLTNLMESIKQRKPPFVNPLLLSDTVMIEKIHRSILTLMEAWSKKFYKKEYTVILSQTKVTVCVLSEPKVLEYSFAEYLKESDNSTKDSTKHQSLTSPVVNKKPIQNKGTQQVKVQTDLKSSFFHSEVVFMENKKRRIVIVPPGWVFLKKNVPIQKGDRFFNLDTHVFQQVEDRDLELRSGYGILIAIRRFKDVTSRIAFIVSGVRMILE